MAPPPPTTGAAPRRLRLRLRGTVQGVGFRPWCAQQATTLGLSGWARNGAGGLEIEVQGLPGQLDAFLDALRTRPPALARVQGMDLQALEPSGEDAGFTIAPSEAEGRPSTTGLPPDTAPCPDCLDELFNPADRRYRYPFINCTLCGPRYTLVRRLPYDRRSTSMAVFTQCPSCQREYDTLDNRRYHAQPNACPECGPRLRWLDAAGREQVVADPIAACVQALRAGAIVALHGVGGFHLVCNGDDPQAVRRLRARKPRPSKPLAQMVLNVASAAQWAEVDAEAAVLLESAARPILLLPLQQVDKADELAPDLDEWGLMLPSTPLHWLLFHEALGRPEGVDWRLAPCPLRLVVTSANPSGEPLVRTPPGALERLAGIADAFLVHDREILARCDDSVRRPLGPGHAPFLRRARGYVPDPVRLRGVAENARPVLALGGWLKNTICVTRGDEAFLSPHIGDLGSRACCRLFDETVDRVIQFVAVRPAAVAHDLHPDFYSTEVAQRLADAFGVPAVGVQHHHAHLAAIAAEHGADAPLLGLMLDGIGFGDDGEAWGGELLWLESRDYRRLSSLPRLLLPGGDAAVREPWRLGAAVLHAQGRNSEIAKRFGHQTAAVALARMLDSGTVLSTSSAGRLFDAAAGLLGLCEQQHYEAEAAMRLEACAARAPAGAAAWPAGWSLDSEGALQLLFWPRLLEVNRHDADAVRLAAARFHATLGEALAAWAAWHLRRQGQRRLALGGGCMINRLLRRALLASPHLAGVEFLEARDVPPGDGGLALGQAWVALHRIGP